MTQWLNSPINIFRGKTGENADSVWASQFRFLAQI